MREQGEKPMPRFDPSKLSSLMTNQNRELLLRQVLHCATSQKVISASQANAKGGELMSIAAGASALKTAVDLARSLRDAAKRGEIKQEEFAGRVGEIYDYIIDSKDALVEAKDEISNLKADLGKRERTATYSWRGMSIGKNTTMEEPMDRYARHVGDSKIVGTQWSRTTSAIIRSTLCFTA
jgi:hypothetical protein